MREDFVINFIYLKPFIIRPGSFGANIFLKGDFMKKSSYTSKQKLQRLTTAAVLTALSLVLMVTIRFPLFTPFYEMEFADLPLLICSAVLGPVYALVSLLVVCIIQTLTVSASSGIIGFFMHFLSSGLLIVTLCLLRKAIKGIKGVIISGICGAIVVVLVMIPMNIWLTSEFMQLPINEFVSGYLGVCIAFNLVKAGSNIILFSLLSPTIKKQYNKLFKIKE